MGVFLRIVNSFQSLTVRKNSIFDIPMVLDPSLLFPSFILKGNYLAINLDIQTFQDFLCFICNFSCFTNIFGMSFSFKTLLLALKASTFFTRFYLSFLKTWWIWFKFFPRFSAFTMHWVSSHCSFNEKQHSNYNQDKRN